MPRGGARDRFSGPFVAAMRWSLLLREEEGEGRRERGKLDLGSNSACHEQEEYSVESKLAVNVQV